MCTVDNETKPVFDRVAGLLDDSNTETFVLTLTLVKAAIEKLKLGGASGPDGLPARLIKKVATV